MSTLDGDTKKMPFIMLLQMFADALGKRYIAQSKVFFVLGIVGRLPQMHELFLCVRPSGINIGVEFALGEFVLQCIANFALPVGVGQSHEAGPIASPSPDLIDFDVGRHELVAAWPGTWLGFWLRLLHNLVSIAFLYSSMSSSKMDSAAFLVS